MFFSNQDGVSGQNHMVFSNQDGWSGPDFSPDVQNHMVFSNQDGVSGQNRMVFSTLGAEPESPQNPPCKTLKSTQKSTLAKSPPKAHKFPCIRLFW